MHFVRSILRTSFIYLSILSCFVWLVFHRNLILWKTLVLCRNIPTKDGCMSQIVNSWIFNTMLRQQYKTCIWCAFLKQQDLDECYLFQYNIFLINYCYVRIFAYNVTKEVRIGTHLTYKIIIWYFVNFIQKFGQITLFFTQENNNFACWKYCK